MRLTLKILFIKIMKAIDLRTALIEANNVNLNGADALVETSILKQLIESCKVRINQLDEEAKAMAQTALTQHGAKKGKFEHNGHHYTLDREDVFNLIEDTKKYNTSDAATYRLKAKKQKALKDQSSALTKEMKTIYDNYPVNHPNIQPDSEKISLKCLD